MSFDEMEGTRDDHVATPAEAAGPLPIGSVEEILQAAGSELAEEILEVPEWGRSLRIRSLTAAQVARINQKAIEQARGNATIQFAELEKARFLEGVIEPKFSPEAVNALYHRSGPAFSRVVKALDRVSGTTREELRQAQDSFPQSQD
jgi:hypothetical protein